jgi:hypothetical protein
MAKAGDPIARSLRSPALRALHEAWLARRSPAGLPRLEDFALDALPASGDLAVAEPVPGTEPVCLRLIRVGANLDRRASRSLLGERIGSRGEDITEDPIGGAIWAYRECLASAAPRYEFADFHFGRDRSLLFERLLLPTGIGGLATHLLVATLFSKTAPEPDGG